MLVSSACCLIPKNIYIEMNLDILWYRLGQILLLLSLHLGLGLSVRSCSRGGYRRQIRSRQRRWRCRWLGCLWRRDLAQWSCWERCQGGEYVHPSGSWVVQHVGPEQRHRVVHAQPGVRPELNPSFRHVCQSLTFRSADWLGEACWSGRRSAWAEDALRRSVEKENPASPSRAHCWTGSGFRRPVNCELSFESPHNRFPADDFVLCAALRRQFIYKTGAIWALLSTQRLQNSTSRNAQLRKIAFWFWLL